MKKSLFTIALLASAFSLKAQTPVGTLVGNFTLTDINGTTHDLYSYLDAGKTVVIDVSATWCGPCWGYHGTGALNNFYNTYGPAGTDEAIAIFIEGDVSTNSADLNGTGSNTQGDWVTGEDLPIIDLTSAASFTNSGLTIPFFPVMYVICPDRLVSQSGIAGVIGTPSLLASYIGDCPAPASQPTDVTMFSFDSQTNICAGTSYVPEVTIRNYGTSPLTNASITITQGGTTVSTGTYTGSLASYAFATVTCTPIASPASGPLVATVTTSGDADATNGVLNTNLTIFSAAAAPFAQNFAASGFPYAEYTLNSPTGDNWAYTAATLKYDCYNYPIGRTGDFVIEPINLSTITNPRLTFDVAHRSYSAANPENDKLEVFISTNCGSTWTSIFSKQGTTLSTGPTQTSVFTPASAADWRNESVSLASYASQNQVFFKFVGTSAFGNNMYVDNINVSSLSSIESNELASSSVYPNPASTEVNVSFEAKGGEYKISITDLVGRTVANEVVANATGSTLVTMSTADLKAGNYLVTITNGSTTYTQNLMVK